MPEPDFSSQTLDLTITALGLQGDGVGVAQDQTFFVPATTAGDVVTVQPVEKTESGWRARLIAVKQAGPERISPPCAHFPACGGCKMQHLRPDSYSAWKTAKVQDVLARAGLRDIILRSPLTSPPRSRRRATFALRHTATGIMGGFNAPRSHEIINLHACQVLRPELMDLLEKLRQHLGLWLPQGSACDARATFVEDALDLVLIGGPPLGLAQREPLMELAEKLGVARLSWRKWDRSPLESIILRQPVTVSFRQGRAILPPGAFLQATAEGESALITLVLQMVAGRRAIADLFCGVGTFALSLPEETRLYAADGDQPAIDALHAATKQRRHAHIEHRNLVTTPVSVRELNAFDAVILDPPRDGAKTQIKHLAQANVPVIAYVSCDATSFARDAAILTASGYRMSEVHLVDQFLWSSHIELAASFSR